MIAYLAHPVGETNGDDAIQRHDNIANALQWVSFFVDATQWSLVVPWHLYVLIEQDRNSPRRLLNTLEILERCDLLVLTGGHISGHMRMEMDRAKRKGIPIVDLTTMSVGPPEASEDVTQLILARTRRAVLTRPRRVWMPLLSDDDMKALLEARHALYTRMPEEHKCAIAIIDRIMMAVADNLH